MHLLRYIGVLFAAIICTSCSQREGYKHAEGMIWNTVYHFTYEGPEELSDSALQVLERVGASLSVFDEASVTSRVNASERCEVDSDFVYIYRLSRLINERSGGAFDPALAPIISAWGFGKDRKASSDTARIRQMLPYCRISTTQLNGDTLVKQDSRTSFNFSSIAKGYGCDQVGAMFAGNGVKDYMVEIGGEIACHGINPSGGKWRVAIDKPISETVNDTQIVIEITDCGLATSGNYRNFHGSGQSRYGHTIDPATGHPVQTDVLSASVVAPTTAEADGYATACMVMGSQRAKEMAKTYDLAIYLILADSTTYASPNFERLISKTK